MTAQPVTLRASDFTDPEQAAYRLNQALNTLRQQLAGPNRLLLDTPFSVDVVGSQVLIVLKPPRWTVKAVKVAAGWDITANAAAFLRVSWAYADGQLVVSVGPADLTASHQYALRLELSDG